MRCETRGGEAGPPHLPEPAVAVLAFASASLWTVKLTAMPRGARTAAAQAADSEGVQSDIEAIVQHREVGGKLEYRVVWTPKDPDQEVSTEWVKQNGFCDGHELLTRYCMDHDLPLPSVPFVSAGGAGPSAAVAVQNELAVRQEMDRALKAFRAAQAETAGRPAPLQLTDEQQQAVKDAYAAIEKFRVFPTTDNRAPADAARTLLKAFRQPLPGEPAGGQEALVPGLAAPPPEQDLADMMRGLTGAGASGVAPPLVGGTDVLGGGGDALTQLPGAPAKASELSLQDLHSRLASGELGAPAPAGVFAAALRDQGSPGDATALAMFVSVLSLKRWDSEQTPQVLQQELSWMHETAGVDPTKLDQFKRLKGVELVMNSKTFLPANDFAQWHARFNRRQVSAILRCPSLSVALPSHAAHMQQLSLVKGWAFARHYEATVVELTLRAGRVDVDEMHVRAVNQTQLLFDQRKAKKAMAAHLKKFPPPAGAEGEP